MGPRGLWAYFRSDPTRGQRSSRGQSALEMPYGHQNLVRRTPDQSVVHCWGQRSCRVTWGQTGVKSISNALWPPNLVGRISDQSVMHCWGQRSCRVSWGQVGVTLLSNDLWTPNLVGRTPDQSVMHCWGQKSWRGQLGSSRGQFA